jgi:hypothetical protein
VAVAVFSSFGSLATAETAGAGYAAVLLLTAALSAAAALVSARLPNAARSSSRMPAPVAAPPAGDLNKAVETA